MKFTSIKKSFLLSISAALLAASVVAPQTGVAAHKGKSGNTEAKNVIVMIADGMGYNQIAATDYFTNGISGSQTYSHFPTRVAMSTYSIAAGGYDAEAAWNNSEYIKQNPTDSAAAGTAMATGVKTYNSGLGIDVNGNAVRNISEYFEKQGKSTGIVTSVQISHATPAAFVAHNLSRNNYSEIANEMLRDSATDVIFGAGHPAFNDDGQERVNKDYRYVGGKNTWKQIREGTLEVSDANGDDIIDEADSWTLVESKEDFQKLQDGKTPDRVLGIAQTATTLQQDRSGDAQAGAFEVPFNDTVPSLDEMTGAALNVLDNNEEGFFLMIEGGALDWAARANQSGRAI